MAPVAKMASGSSSRDSSSSSSSSSSTTERETPERSSVRKIERASARKLPVDRPSARSLEKADKSDKDKKESVSKLERASARKLERASKSDLTADATHAPKKAVAAQPPLPVEPPKKRSWKRELFRAMVDALRDILRAERRS